MSNSCLCATYLGLDSLQERCKVNYLPGLSSKAATVRCSICICICDTGSHPHHHTSWIQNLSSFVSGKCLLWTFFFQSILSSEVEFIIKKTGRKMRPLWVTSDSQDAGRRACSNFEALLPRTFQGPRRPKPRSNKREGVATSPTNLGQLRYYDKQEINPTKAGLWVVLHCYTT